MRRYRVLLPLTVHTEDGSYTQGEEFEKDFTLEDEATNVASGLLAIVPSEYRVISDSTVYDTTHGNTFTRALTIGEEAHLVAAGHIERVEPMKSQPQKKKSAKEAKV
jgi:hypothetical protein